MTAAAHNLTANPKLKIKLEGNTDERGTREYNIGLGERRAQAVRRALMLQGVAESQVTHGELRGRAAGGRRAMTRPPGRKNRRVEVVYLP